MGCFRKDIVANHVKMKKPGGLPTADWAKPTFAERKRKGWFPRNSVEKPWFRHEYAETDERKKNYFSPLTSSAHLLYNASCPPAAVAELVYAQD